MTGKVGSTVVAEAVVLLLLFMNHYGIVKANDAAPIPAVKRQVMGWFSANVTPLAERKWLDPALVTAEAEAGPTKVIKVMQDGSGDFKTITEAVNSVPSGNTKRVIIFIGGGVYFERVTIEQRKPFVTLYGSPDDTPTLVFNGSNAEYGQEQGATLTVESDYFVGANLIIKGAQALRASGNKGSYYNCGFSGLQNTLFDDRGLHLFMDCYIEGLEDFIFGSGTSLYLNTELHVLADPNIRSVITADTRRPHDNDRTPGYSFVHCTITGDAKNALLGRAWLSNPRVVFAYTDMGANIIAPEGWFDNNPSEGNSTVYYAEYKNTGAGASTTRRVSYSKQLTDAEAKPFVTLGYIQGSKWLLPPPSP